MTDPEDAVEAELPGIAAEVLDWLAQYVPPAERGGAAGNSLGVLLASAALLPATRAPGGPVVELLVESEGMLGSCPALRSLVRATAEALASTDLPLSTDALSRDWQRELGAARQEAGVWLAAERQATLPGVVPTDFWHYLLERWSEDGRSSIGELFHHLVSPPDAGHRRRVREIAESWREPADRDLGRLLQARQGSANARIVGRARLRLREKISEAVAMADRWEAIWQREPEGAERFQQPIARVVRDAASEHGPAAGVEAGEFGGGFGPSAVALLDRYLAAMRGGAGEPATTRLRLEDLLTGEFLPWIDYPRDPNLEQTLAILGQSPPDPEAASKRAIEAGRLARAEAILDFGRRCGRLREEAHDALSQLLRTERARAEAEFDGSLERIEARIQEAERDTILDPDLAEQMRSTLLAAMEQGVGAHHARMLILRQVEEQVEKLVARCRRDLRKSFRTLKRPPAGMAHQFEKAVRANQFGRARELLDQARQKAGGG